jgi:hypothetical protein
MASPAQVRLSSLLAVVAFASGAHSAVAQPLPDPGQPPPGTTAPPPPPDEDWDPGAPPPNAQNVPPPPPDAVPPAQPPDQNTFQRHLSPYGHWEQTPEYGLVWVPNVPPDWQPYTDGHWVETAWGWSFVSAVPWGAIVFHYGRWGFRAGLGWFWVPGYVWAPAWVAWRYAPGYICWSPYGPPGFVYPRGWPGWVVVPSRAFTRPIHAHRVPWPHATPVIRAARPAPSIVATPRRGSFYGPPREFVHRELSRGPQRARRDGDRRRR